MSSEKKFLSWPSSSLFSLSCLLIPRQRPPALPCNPYRFISIGVCFSVISAFSVHLSAEVAWAEAALSKEPDPLPQNVAIQPGDEVNEARQLLKVKKWAEAAILLRSALRKSPSSAVAMDLARALTFSGRREDALNVLGQALAVERSARLRQELIQKSRVISRVFLTNGVFQVHQDGINLMMIRKYRAAREKFEKVLEQEPANVESLIRLGQCLVLEGDYDSAAERLRLARRLNPYEFAVQLWLGRALYQRGEMSEALDDLKLAYQDQPGSETSAIWLAEAFMAVNRKDQALKILSENVSLRPDNVGALVALAQLRMNTAPLKDVQSVWQSRKDLQLALSRLSEYLAAVSTSVVPLPAAPKGVDAPAPPLAVPNSDLSLDQRSSEDELKLEIQRLISQADARIESTRKLPGL